MTDNNNAIKLLDRYLAGESGTGEKELVERWYEGIALDRQQDTTQWAEASKALFLRQHQRKTYKQYPFQAIKWAAAAAILIILAGAGLFFSGDLRSSAGVAVTKYSAVTGAAALKQVLLPDSSVVWLNANSRLEWSSSYIAGERRVILSGEASFDVHHDPAHPFVVHTPDADVKVLGTRFNVETDSKNATTHVALLRGKVTVNLPEENSRKLELAPGEVAACSAAGKSLKKFKTDVNPYFSWMNGGFSAYDMPLRQAVEKLCAKYGYTVTWLNRRGGHKHISVTFPRQEFRNMLENLCYLDRLQYTIHDKVVTIR